MGSFRLLKNFAFLLCLISSSCALAFTFSIEKDGAGTSILYLTDAGSKTAVGLVTVVQRGQLLYHWGKQQEAETLKAQSGLDLNSVTERIKGMDRGGGGFYISTSPIDSIAYGPTLSASVNPNPFLEVPRETYKGLLVRQHLENISPENMEAIASGRRQINLELQKAGVASIQLTPTWKVLIRPEPFSAVRTPKLSELIGSVKAAHPAGDLTLLELINPKKERPEFLDDLRVQLWPEITSTLASTGAISQWPHYDPAKLSFEQVEFVQNYNHYADKLMSDGKIKYIGKITADLALCITRSIDSQL